MTTTARKPSTLRGGGLRPLQLHGRWHDGSEFKIDLNRDRFIIGRRSDSDLVVPASAPYVSGKHVEIQRTPAGYAIVDLNSTNGTLLNNRRIAPQTLVPIKGGDIFRIGSERFGSSLGFEVVDPRAVSSTQNGYSTFLGSTSLNARVQRVKIGRDPDNDIVLAAPTVGKLHAIIQKFDAEHHLIRAREGNTLLINGAVVEEAQLRAGDELEIGPFQLKYDGQSLQQFGSIGYRLDVIDVYKEVKTRQGKLRILDDISLTIEPREFVALVGGSGAGKSTLLDALNGFRPAKGKVLINGRDLYNHYNEFRQQLGYVPQYDILPTALTVDAALNYAAKLRLPTDISGKERRERIAQALDTVEMNTDRIRATRISRLSGGQRKRVSIAAELLADPKIFFLDEPASGLDPGLEKKLMYTLRKMADEGRTIVMITHATDNIVQVDNVAFLSQGKLIYYGPPQETLPFFEVEEFADIYEKIERDGDRWRQTFTQEKSEQYQRYVLARQATVPAGTKPARSFFNPFRWVRNTLRQYIVLCQRMLRLTLSDPIALFVGLFVMPLVALQQLLVGSRYELVGEPEILADAAGAAQSLTENYLPALESHTFIFGMAILAFLVGAFGGSQELIKERSVYLRERMVNLKILPYLSSKFIIFGLFALLQTTLYVLILSIGLALPESGVLLPGAVEMGITLFLTVMVGIATGLFISAVSGNSTVAMYFVLLIVFFQYIFGGAIHNLRDKPIEVQSYIAATRWSALAMGTTVDVNELAEATIVCANAFELDSSNVTVDPNTGIPDFTALELVETDEPACSNRAMTPDELYLPYGETGTDLLRFWSLLLLLGGGFGVATLVMVKRLDSRQR